MFIDTHAHILSEYYENTSEVIKRAAENGITRIINNGCDGQSNKEVIESLSKEVYGAIGIHPESVDKYTDEDITFIKENIKNPKIVAIGEIGLDYYYTKENKEEQKKLFELQLAIAEEAGIPVIIHSREATEDTINILKKYKVRGVIHSFSGSYETAVIYLKMGFKLGINGVITFKNAKIKDVISRLPLDSIVLETDSPYLSPVPLRGKQNESKNIIYIAKFVAELFGIELPFLAEVTNESALSIFDKLKLE